MKKEIKLLVESLFDDEFDNIYDGGDIDIELSSKLVYNYHPKTFNELRNLLRLLLDERGKDADLNDIDVSLITTFYDEDSTDGLFEMLDPHNIDISRWDVSNVTNMSCMFWHCKNFNSDLSRWDVSNVTNMSGMFYNCFNFTSDLSNWDVSNVKNMSCLFNNCKKFTCDLSRWDVSNVKNMKCIFNGCNLLIIPAWLHK